MQDWKVYSKAFVNLICRFLWPSNSYAQESGAGEVPLCWDLYCCRCWLLSKECPLWCFCCLTCVFWVEVLDYKIRELKALSPCVTTRPQQNFACARHRLTPRLQILPPWRHRHEQWKMNWMITNAPWWIESQGVSCGGKISRRFLDGSWGKNKQLAGSLWKMIHWRVIESQWLPDAVKLVKDVFVAKLQYLDFFWSFGKMSGSHFWRTISKHHFAELWVT